VNDLRAPLRELFGFDDFRPGQEEVVRAAVEGRDLLALMPTGSGKSLTYQLAAMLRPAPTLVLSPLIALMKDQVDKLPPQVAEVATFVNSSLEASETAERIAAVREGRARLLYAAPERLRQRGFVEVLRSVGVSLVVIDEVHCVSMWGHDFRPDYLFIRRALDLLGRPTVLGMTATATPRTAEEIATALGRSPEVVRTSVVRPNLRYDIEQVTNQNERLESLIERLHQLQGASAIVYARSRRSCEDIARTLRSHGLNLEHYHAGLDASERTRVQDDFVHGRIQGVVATTAFGMGIDKPDVRLVCLVNLPDSLESYVQMVGRAGRDGEPSDTLLLASPSDATALRRFSTESQPDAGALRRVYRALRDRDGVATPDELVQAIGDDHDPRVLVGMLQQAGLVDRGFDTGRALSVEFPPPPGDAATSVDELLVRYRTEAVARCERMVAFASSRQCRHAEVARHFGETPPSGSCHACDVCAPRGSSRRALRVTATLPSDIAASIVTVVRNLTWPVGRKSLIATLRGTVSAPKSARRSGGFGILSGATDAEVKRWIVALERAGALVLVETEDGFSVLQAGLQVSLPNLNPGRGGAPGAAVGPDDPTFERLRSWRADRSKADGVPAYVVLHDATLRELVATRPTSENELAAVKGLGPAKLERYGEAILTVLGSS
jgi:ATP-dependent DNA helicase RecQ